MKRIKIVTMVGGHVNHHGDLNYPTRVTRSLNLGPDGVAELWVFEPEKPYAYWPGGENPAPGKWVDLILRNGDAFTRMSDCFRWYHVKGDDLKSTPDRDIIAWRLASDQGDGNA